VNFSQKVNLAGIPSLRSSDLSGLLSRDVEGVCPLEALILNNTGIDDEAAVYLGGCTELGTLELAGTRVTRKRGCCACVEPGLTPDRGGSSHHP